MDSKGSHYFEAEGYLFQMICDNNYLYFLQRVEKKTEKEAEENNLSKQIKTELEQYFNGKRKSFDIPLKTEGTVFQKKVWKALNTIAYGSTCSYQAIAEKIGNPKACRAIGGANNKNPIIIIVPCHRVIGKNGNLTGYGGGLDLKQMLIDKEKAWKNL